MQEQTPFDFIIVGAGTAGCVLAARLAASPRRPRVLLLEAGGSNASHSHRAAGERLTYWMTAAENYRYKSRPEPALDNREIVYDRGHGLGGSSVVNIGVWDYGRREEYDEWASLVGDDVWAWEEAVTRFRRVENMHNDTPAELRRYVPGREENHGSAGPLDVSYPATWSPSVKLVVDAAERAGIALTDLYSGDLGVGVPASNTYRGLRNTSGTAYLADPPKNLQIVTDAVAARVLFDDDRKATGVQLHDGTKYLAAREVILCAGSIDTPKLLLLSGVGPREELAKHSIPATAILPGVGRNLGDHCMLLLMATAKDGTVPLVGAADLQAWKAQWDADQTGPLGQDVANMALAYARLPDIRSFPEFAELDEKTREYLTRPRTAHFELGMSIRSIPDLMVEKPVIRVACIIMNAQSRGRVSLRSADPADPPLLELGYMEHPYDRRVLLEAVKVARTIIYGSGLPAEEVLVGPASWEDEDVLKHIRQTLGTTWHACGTVKMGKVGEEGTCVNTELRVVGVGNLRVADLSVCPVIPSNHTQSTAYLIGEIAAEKIMKEYNL